MKVEVFLLEQEQGDLEDEDSEEQIVKALQEHEIGGKTIVAISRELGIAQATFCTLGVSISVSPAGNGSGQVEAKI